MVGRLVPMGSRGKAFGGRAGGLCRGYIKKINLKYLFWIKMTHVII